MTKDYGVVRLHTLIAELLELDEKQVKEKLKPLPEKLVELISSNNKIILTGVLEITPNFLEAGEFLNTTKHEYVYVGARISPKVKLQKLFAANVKQKRLTNLTFY